MPRWLKDLQWWLVDTLMLDRLAAPPLNEIRADLGLGPVKGIVREYWNSPQRHRMYSRSGLPRRSRIGRRRLRLTGFPLYDEPRCGPDFPDERAIAF